MAPEDPTDLLVTLAAESVFDVTDWVHWITAPTLVIRGGEDAGNPPELIKETAAGITDGSAPTYADCGHNRTCMSSRTANLMLAPR